MSRPQFAARTHRAREYLLEFGRGLPALWGAYERVRQRVPQPPGIYVTEEAGAEAFLSAVQEMGDPATARALAGMGALEITRVISPHTTLAAWRMTQGIYRVDPAVYAALVDTPLEGDIPGDVLLRLPEWCIYLETPGLMVESRSGSQHQLHGVWARLDAEGDRRLLILLLDIEGASLQETHAVPLAGTLHDSLVSILHEWGVDQAGAAIAERYLLPVINLLLYICSSGADISGRSGQPGNPTPTRTRRDGWRLFPASGLRVWDVGVRMGAALRAAYQSAETGASGDHAGPRGHVRRAHWHGFRSGPRKRDDGSEIPTAQRRFDLRWLPPIPVNLPDVDNLPAVIRRV